MSKNVKFLCLINVILISMICIISRGNLFASKLDFIPQHLQFFEYLRNLFGETKNFFPQFMINLGAGQNIYNISYYGLYSPYLIVSYLVFFLDTLTFLNIAMYVNIIVSTFFLFKLLNKDYDTKLSIFVAIVFMLSTPLLFHFKRHIMFIDYMMFLMMSIYYIRTFFETNKTYPIIIFNTLIIFTSFYYSISCFFVIFLYYISMLIKYDKFKIQNWKENFLFLLKIYLIPVLISSILTIPTLYVILNGRSNDGSTINLIDLFINKNFSILYDTYSLGIIFIVFISLIYNFMNKKKDIKFLSIIILIVLIVPLFNFILNGGLYIREKILIPFLPLLMISFIEFLKDSNNKKKIISYLLFGVISLIFGYSIYNNDIFLLLILDIVLGFIFIILNSYNKQIIGYILLISFLIIINIGTNKKDSYMTNEEFNTIYNTSLYESFDVINNDFGYYKTSILSGNSSNIVNYTYDMNHNSTALYSSTYNTNYYNFIHNTFDTDFRARNKLFQDISDNNLFNLYMGVKYVFNTNMNDIFYSEIEKQDNTRLYQANNYVPLIYSSTNILSTNTFNKLSYPDKIEALFNSIIVENEIDTSDYDYTTKEFNTSFKVVNKKNNIEIKKIDNTINISAKDKSKFNLVLEEKLENRVLFISFNIKKPQSCDIGDMVININGQLNKLTCSEWLYYNENTTFNYIITDKVIEKLNVEINKGNYEITDFTMYTADANKFINNFNAANIIQTKDNIIKASITLNEDSYVNINLPYDKGFKIFVNNKETKYTKTNTAFIGFKLNSGKYDIEIKYTAPLFNVSFIFMILGLILLGCVLYFEVYKRRKMNE